MLPQSQSILRLFRPKRWRFVVARQLQTAEIDDEEEVPHIDDIDSVPWLSSSEFERIKFQNTMEPYWDLDYEEQLRKKQFLVEQSMKKFAHLAGTNKHRHTSKFRQQLEEFQGHAILPDMIKPSPVISSYRNKNNYSIGTGYDGTPKRVGYCVYSRLSRSHFMSNGHLVSNRRAHYEISKLFEEFIQKSALPVMSYHEGLRSGHWRGITIRSNQTGDLLVSVGFNPLQAHQDIIDRAREDVFTYFMNGPGRYVGLKTLYFEKCRYRRCMNSAQYDLLSGDGYLNEEISGYRFRVSPDAFLQLNTKAAEVLYDTIREYGNLNHNTTLLDVCCGTGTIGIVLSQYVKKVIGLEYIASAVKDAQHNASINGVNNAEYHCGRAERELKNITNGMVHGEAVAVVNPGRGGLGAKVMRALRRCDAISTVIFVSCRPEGRGCFNFAGLVAAEDEKFPNRPFLPTRAVSVDMFPNTRHYDLVLVFQR